MDAALTGRGGSQVRGGGREAVWAGAYPPLHGRRRREHERRKWADRDATVLKACDRLSNLADALLQYDPAFCARCAWRTRTELLAPGLPLADDPIARPLLEAAIRRCEEWAAGTS